MQGDSGGPLVCRQNQQWVLSGIISFTIEMSPAVFTRVASYKDWLMEVIKKDEAKMKRIRDKQHHLLASYFQNRMIEMPAQINGYPFYNYILYRKLIPYIDLKHLYGKYILKI